MAEGDGFLFNRYEILEELGTGGSSIVYKAFDHVVDRLVAIKRLPNLPNLAPRAEREAEALLSLSHPNIVSVYDVERTDDFYFIVMEYLEGVTLDRLLPHRPMSVRGTLGIALQVSSALEYAHTYEIIHRDIKPENLMVLPNGRVKLLDFGIALIKRQTRITQDGGFVGTVGWVSPEQVDAGVVDERTDEFLLGILMYRMLTGIGPFEAETAAGAFKAVMSRNPDRPHALNPAVPEALDSAVMRALSKHSEDRWDTVTEFRYKFDRSFDGRSPESVVRALYEGEEDEPSPEAAAAGEGPLGRLRLAARSMWKSDAGRAESPVSAVLAGLIVLAILAKAFGLVWPILIPVIGSAALGWYRPHWSLYAVLGALLVAAGVADMRLLVIGVFLAAGYAMIWRNDAGYAPMLPFAAPLVANAGVTVGFGMGLFFPFIAGYTLPPVQAAVVAALGGFLLQAYDLVYSETVRFLEVTGPYFAGQPESEKSQGIAAFFIKLGSPYATNPFIFFQPLVLAGVALLVSSFRERAARVQALVAALAIVLLLFGLSASIPFSADQGEVFVSIVRQVLAIIIPVGLAVLARSLFVNMKSRGQHPENRAALDKEDRKAARRRKREGGM